jgi:presenilin-like A22 family membrane protease
MENQNLKIEKYKNPLPIKTKIVAWWIIIGKSILSFFTVKNLLKFKSGFFEPFSINNTKFTISNSTFIISLIFYLSSLFIFIAFSLWIIKYKKRWAWYIILILLILDIIGMARLFLLHLALSTEMFSIESILQIQSVFWLVLLLIDRKNFFKVAK